MNRHRVIAIVGGGPAASPRPNASPSNWTGDFRIYPSESYSSTTMSPGPGASGARSRAPSF